LVLLGAGPEPAGPLPAVAALAPRPRDPGPPWRGDAPEAAHPEEAFLVLVPLPVSGNPLDVLAFRLLIPGELLDLVWRLLGNNRRSGRLTLAGLGEGLVDRAAAQDFDIVSGNGGSRQPTCQSEREQAQS